jgi:hypothetical protein
MALQQCGGSQVDREEATSCRRPSTLEFKAPRSPIVWSDGFSRGPWANRGSGRNRCQVGAQLGPKGMYSVLLRVRPKLKLVRV